MLQMQHVTSFTTDTEILHTLGRILSNLAVVNRHDLPVTNDVNSQKYHHF
jgi:hypothetical protein